MSVVRNYRPQSTITAAVTLTPEQSGTTFVCTKAAGADYTVTLPDPSIPGISYTMVMANAGAVAHAINFTSPTANTVFGMWRQTSGASTNAVNGSNITTISFTATAVASDRIDLESDGTNWRAVGSSGVAAGCAFS